MLGGVEAAPVAELKRTLVKHSDIHAPNPILTKRTKHHQRNRKGTYGNAVGSPDAAVLLNGAAVAGVAPGQLHSATQAHRSTNTNLSVVSQQAKQTTTQQQQRQENVHAGLSGLGSTSGTGTELALQARQVDTRRTNGEQW